MELLVVLAILALIAVIAVPLYLNQLSKSRIQTARIQVEQLGTILDMYRLDVGVYPSSADGLEALLTQPPGVDRWGGPYLKKRESLTDPWRRLYEYRAPGDHGDYDLWSNGADGTEGGEDEDTDITSW
jgi:general secretion pathway protein G